MAAPRGHGWQQSCALIVPVHMSVVIPSPCHLMWSHSPHGPSPFASHMVLAPATHWARIPWSHPARGSEWKTVHSNSVSSGSQPSPPSSVKPLISLTQRVMSHSSWDLLRCHAYVKETSAVLQDRRPCSCKAVHSSAHAGRSRSKQLKYSLGEMTSRFN